MRSLLLPTTPAILPTTQKHFDWAVYCILQNFIMIITDHSPCTFSEQSVTDVHVVSKEILIVLLHQRVHVSGTYTVVTVD